MDLNVEVFPWKMVVDDESNQNVLEQNLLQHDNTLWNVIGFNESDWYRNEPKGSQRFL